MLSCERFQHRGFSVGIGTCTENYTESNTARQHALERLNSLRTLDRSYVDVVKRNAEFLMLSPPLTTGVVVEPRFNSLVVSLFL